MSLLFAELAFALVQSSGCSRRRDKSLKEPSVKRQEPRYRECPAEIGTVGTYDFSADSQV